MTEPYSDLAEALGFSPPPQPRLDAVGLLKSLGRLPALPTDVQLVRGATTVHDGVAVTALSWFTGYGPRTEAYLLRPDGVDGPLPGVLWLHSHDDVKSVGKEKVVDGPCSLPPELAWVRRDHYGGRAPANALAKRGYSVVVHDAFMWGSRRFTAMPPRLAEVLESVDYERQAVMFESMALSKYLSLFGTTLAGLLNFDDRVAVHAALSLPEVDGSLRCIGLSGGGCRAVYLHATCPELVATVSVGAMATYPSMLRDHVAPHSWMFFPHDLASRTDWPGVAAIGCPTPLLVQYCSRDQLFTPQGMADAHDALSKLYAASGAAGAYCGQSYPVLHSFTIDMQEAAFDWLDGFKSAALCAKKH